MLKMVDMVHKPLYIAWAGLPIGRGRCDLFTHCKGERAMEKRFGVISADGIAG
jgi:hypothetical protein